MENVVQNLKSDNLKKTLFFGIFLLLAFGLFFAFQIKSQDLPFLEQDLTETEVLGCDKVPYGRHLARTKAHLDEFLPLLAGLTRQARQVSLSGWKLANMSKDCRSENCAAACACLPLPSSGGGFACTTPCSPVGCFEFHPVLGYRVAHPCMPRTRDLKFYPRNLPKEEYKKAKASAEEFGERIGRLLELANSLDDLKRENENLAEAFAVWYRERTVSDLENCFELRDKKLLTCPITECPFEGNTYYILK